MVIEVVAAVFFLAILGFLVSAHIFHEKHFSGEDMKCGITEGCNDVVNSEYSEVYGIPLEVMGLLYYGLVAVVAGIALTGTQVLFDVPLFTFLLVVGGIAAVVSSILTYIQWQILEIWCQYCLFSAWISVMIFLVELLPYTGLVG